MVVFIPPIFRPDISSDFKHSKEYKEYVYNKWHDKYIEEGNRKNRYIKDWVRAMQEYMFSKYGRDLGDIRNHYFLQPKLKQWYIRKIINLKLVKKWGWKQVFTNNV